MGDWKRYVFAILRGAVKGIPALGGIMEELLRVLDEAQQNHEKQVQQAFQSITFEVTPEPISEDQVAQFASKAWRSLDKGRQTNFQKKLINFVEEGEEEKQQTLAIEFAVQVTQALVKHMNFGQAPTECIEFPTPTDNRFPAIGELAFQRFKIESKLGEGGFGVVYKAYDIEVKYHVALKLSKIESIIGRLRFEREAVIGFRLGQLMEGVPRTYARGTDEESQVDWMAIDLAPGACPLDLKTGSIRDRIKRLIQAARIVAKAHKFGLIHRDLKPNNLIVDERGQCHLMDFGIAKMVDSKGNPSMEELTQIGMMSGTPVYMPPEQFLDFKNTGQQADVYAFGVMLFEVLTGDHPFTGKVARKQRLVEQGSLEMPRPSQLNLDCPLQLNDLCLHALALNEEERLESLDLFLVSLEKWLSWSLLEQLELWNKASELEQDHAISLCKERLKPHFEWHETSVYSLQGQTQRIASFRQIKSGVILNLIPGGSYYMGHTDHPDEQPVRKVKLSEPFLIGRFQTKQSEWDAFGGNDGRTWREPDLPIEGCSLCDVREWLTNVGDGLRLPSEAEWEYACRAGSRSKYYWGDHFDPSHCWHEENSGSKVQPSRVHWNAGKWNAFGLIDTNGNLWEWCQDQWFDDYSEGPFDQRARCESGVPYHVNRGGSWKTTSTNCYSAYRDAIDENRRKNDVGFRIALSISLD